MVTAQLRDKIKEISKVLKSVGSNRLFNNTVPDTDVKQHQIK